MTTSGITRIENTMKSKTKIQNQLGRKTSREFVETVIALKKSPEWQKVASVLSGPRRTRIGLNIGEVSRNAKAGETIVVPGKVLSLGEVDKKLRVVALGFSERAMEKILNAKGEALTLMEEVEKNPSGKGIKIFTGK